MPFALATKAWNGTREPRLFSLPSPSDHSLSQRSARLSAAAAFALTLTILVARAWPRILFAELWGEDGRIFTSHALHHGFESVFWPMHGSFFLLQRLFVVLAIKLLPLAWLPTVIAIASVALAAFVFARVSHRDLEWILPDAKVRWGLAVLLCLLPGLGEMLGNLCNTNWILFAWVSFLALRDPCRRATWTELIFLALAVLSMGTAVLLLPVFGWRVLQAWRGSGPRSHVGRESLQLAIVAFLGVLPPVLVGGPPHATIEPAPLLNVLPLWLSHVAELALVAPWLGDRATIALRSQQAAVWTGVVIVLGAALAFGAWRLRRLQWPAVLAVWGLAASTWTILASRMRPSAFGILQNVHDDRLYVIRHSFAVSFVGLMWWVAVVGSPGMPARTRHLLLAAFFAIAVATSLHRFPVAGYGLERKWEISLAALESAYRTGCPPVVLVQQYPQGWAFGFTPPKSQPSCSERAAAATD